jgi:hypothetical protein
MRDWHTLVVQDARYKTIFNTLATVINPFFAGLQLRMAFHDAGTFNPNAQYKGGCVHSWSHSLFSVPMPMPCKCTC